MHSKPGSSARPPFRNTVYCEADAFDHIHMLICAIEILNIIIIIIIPLFVLGETRGVRKMPNKMCYPLGKDAIA